MGRIRRLPLCRRQPFSFWRSGPQGKATPPVPPVPIEGHWGIKNSITAFSDPAPAVGWDKGATDDTALLTTSDKAQLDITSDICLVACIRPDVVASGAFQRIFGKWGTSGQFSYGLALGDTGRIILTLSPNGTTISNEGSGATAPLTGVLDDGEKFWIAAAIDSTNAATTGRDKKYWWRRDGDTAWTQLGVTQTNTPAQNIFSGSGDLSIGRYPGDTATQFNGTIYNIAIYSGIGTFTNPGEGTLVAAADMRTPWVSDTYSDGLGNTWTRVDGVWKPDPIYTIATSTGLTGARFPHRGNDTEVLVPDSGNDSLSKWSYATGTSITLKGSTGTTTNLDGARSSVASADQAYAFTVSLESDRFTVHDIRHDTPQFVTSLQDATNLDGARAIIRVGNYCYVTARDGGRVTSVRVTDPTNPVVVSSVAHANLTDVRGIAHYNGYILAAANSVDRITAINISNPENITYATSLQDATNLDGIHEIVTYQNAAICACVNTPGRVTAVDLTNLPTSMSIASSITQGIILQSAYGLEVDSGTGRAYIDNLDLGWVTVLDASDWATSLDFMYSVRPTGFTTGGGIYLDESKDILVVVSFDEGKIALMKVTDST